MAQIPPQDEISLEDLLALRFIGSEFKTHNIDERMKDAYERNKRFEDKIFVSFGTFEIACHAGLAYIFWQGSELKDIILGGNYPMDKRILAYSFLTMMGLGVADGLVTIIKREDPHPLIGIVEDKIKRTYNVIKERVKGYINKQDS